MDNFNLKKYLAEGKLLKESTLEYLIDKYGQKMIDFTIKVDQLTDGEVNDIEYLEDRIKTHLEEPAIRQKYLAEGKLINESAPGYDTRKTGEALPTLESVKAAYEAKNDIKEDEGYDTGGYIESMGPEFEKGINSLIDAWEEWNLGPATEPGMVPYAKQEILKYLEMQLFARKPIK